MKIKPNRGAYVKLFDGPSSTRTAGSRQSHWESASRKATPYRIVRGCAANAERDGRGTSLKKVPILSVSRHLELRSPLTRASPIFPSGRRDLRFSSAPAFPSQAGHRRWLLRSDLRAQFRKGPNRAILSIHGPENSAPLEDDPGRALIYKRRALGARICAEKAPKTSEQLEDDPNRAHRYKTRSLNARISA